MTLKAQSNSKSGHKNIHYDETAHSYVVRIYRKHNLFVTYLDTLDEAIFVRDKVYDFYKKNGFLPKKSDLDLKRRSRRVFKERIKKVKPRYVCRICNKTMRYKTQSEIDGFERRGNVCGDCSPTDRGELSLKINQNRPNHLEEKYIALSIRDTRTYYQVTIYKRRRSISKAFRSLSDAIVFRDQMLDFYKEHDRLPDDSELVSIFKIELYNRPISNELKESNNSATGLKNITYHSTQNLYYVNIIRNRVKTATSFKTLEEAKLARKIILEEYDRSGIMLRAGEVRARMKELSESK